MPFTPGKANRRVTIQTKTQTRGASGGFVNVWADSATTWAEELSMTSGEARQLLAVRADATVVLKIRKRPLTSQHRLYYRGNYYDILGTPIEDAPDALIITARTIEEVATA